MSIKQGVLVLAIVTAMLVPAAQAGAGEAAARDLVKAVLDALPQVPFASKLEVTTPQGARTVALSSKRVEGARASYLEVVGPEALKGIRFLFIEKPNAPPEQFIKVAAGRNAVRVADQIRRQPFLESAFYVSDLVEPELDAFEYRTVGDEEVGGRQCRLIEAVPKKPDAEIYGKTVLALDPKDLIIMRRQFFDKSGKMVKEWKIEKVEKIDGYWTLMKHEMNNIQDKITSKLEITAIKYNADLSDAMFTPKYLLRQ
jgi:hypothetical protein